jgi:hypothetical protein
MKNSFVAFFDVLGFKNLVEKNSHEELMDIYDFGLYESINQAEKMTNLILGAITPSKELESLKVKIYVISDSIIFIQENLTQRGLLYIISYCRMLIGATMADGIPIRGGLSYGPVSVGNQRGTTIVGMGLTNAYNIESKQNWAGGIVDRKCFDIVPKENQDLINHLINNKQNPIITEYNVPIKDGSFSKELVFDWTIYSLIKSEEDIKKSFIKHDKKVNSSVQAKIDNTVKFYNEKKKK